MPNDYTKTYHINGQPITVTQRQVWYDDEYQPTDFKVTGRIGPNYFSFSEDGQAPDTPIALKRLIASKGHCSWTGNDDREWQRERTEETLSMLESDVARAERLVKQRKEALPRAMEIAKEQLLQAQETLAYAIKQRDDVKAELQKLI